MTDFDLHRIELGGEFHCYTMTVQVHNQDMVADAAITAVVHGNKPFSCGFSQCVSDAGVETFNGAALRGKTSYVSNFDKVVLYRTNVTSVTLGVFGDGGTIARYVLRLTEPAGRDGGGASQTMAQRSPAAGGRLSGAKAKLAASAAAKLKGKAVPAPRKSTRFVVYDKKSGTIAHIHEVVGDDDFIATQAGAKTGAAAALAFARQYQPKLQAATLKLADKDMLAPGQTYKIDVKKATLVPVKRGR